MTYLEALTNLLKDHPQIYIPKSILEEDVKPMADSIYPCSKRNKQGRSYDEVYLDCSSIAIEFALEHVLQSIGESAQMNPLSFDKSNKASYMYDVEHTTKQKKYLIECKRMGGEWFSKEDSEIATFVKHHKELDTLVTAYLDDIGDNILVTFSIVCNAKTFLKYWNTSQYRKNSSYYNHRSAQKDKQCGIIKLMPAKY